MCKYSFKKYFKTSWVKKNTIEVCKVQGFTDRIFLKHSYLFPQTTILQHNEDLMDFRYTACQQ